MGRKVEGRSAAIGVTVKSGWAAIVLLGGPGMSLDVWDSRTLDLSDPSVPGARQPYHAGFETERRSGPLLSRLVSSVEEFGRRSVAGLIHRYRAEGHRLVGVGVVVGSLIDPKRIANAHVRIHALEGRLFRSVVESGAREEELECFTWRERDLYARAAATLKKPQEELREALSALRRPKLRPWRAEQKAATLAAWLVLADTFTSPPSPDEFFPSRHSA